MKPLCFFMLAATMLLTARAQDPGKADLDKLRGTWAVVSMIDDGKNVADPKQSPKVKLAYEGQKWYVLVGDMIVARGGLAIDPTKKPREIDILDETGEKNDKTKLGIYELTGDTYKYCLAPAGKPRPKDFTSTPGSGHSLAVMKREKP